MRNNSKLKRTLSFFLAQEKNIHKQCEFSGCKEPGLFLAPKSPDNLEEKRCLCLHHVRLINENWNYFSGLSESELERQIKFSGIWERHTKPLSGNIYKQAFKIDEKLKDFFDFKEKQEAETIVIEKKYKSALEVLNLSYPYTEIELKTSYKKMAKKFHPDLHKNDPDAEENIKKVNISYSLLMEYLEQNNQNEKHVKF